MSAYANGASTDDRFRDEWEGYGVGPANDDAPRTSDVRPVAPVAPWVERLIPSSATWFTKVPPKRAWLLRDSRTRECDGALPLGKVALLIGEGGVSKTMALIALVIAVATGTSWLGAYAVATTGRVLALLGEEDAEEVPRRMYNARRATSAPVPADDAIVVLPLAGLPCALIEADERGNPRDTTFLIWLRAYVKEHGPFALVVVDPLSRFAGADAEVDNAAATRFVQALESIATETGATVIVAHHTNKMARTAGAAITGAAARGASAIHDGVRWAAALTAEKVQTGDAEVGARLGEIVTLSIVKSNYSRKGDPLLLRRDHANGGALLPLDETDLEMVVEARAGAEPSVRRREAQAAARQTRHAAVDAALRAVLEARPGIGSRDLRAAMAARLSGCSAENVADALERAGDLVRRDPGPGKQVRHYLNGKDGA